jgi:hypothetical protein
MRSIKYMAQKILFFHFNIWAEILLHILGYSFCSEHHILAQLC